MINQKYKEDPFAFRKKMCTLPNLRKKISILPNLKEANQHLAEL